MLLARELTERVIGLAIEVYRLTGPFTRHRALPRLYHWFAEHHAHDSDHLGPDATVEIIITPR